MIVICQRRGDQNVVQVQVIVRKDVCQIREGAIDLVEYAVQIVFVECVLFQQRVECLCISTRVLHDHHVLLYVLVANVAEGLCSVSRIELHGEVLRVLQVLGDCLDGLVPIVLSAKELKQLLYVSVSKDLEDLDKARIFLHDRVSGHVDVDHEFVGDIVEAISGRGRVVESF